MKTLQEEKTVIKELGEFQPEFQINWLMKYQKVCIIYKLLEKLGLTFLVYYCYILLVLRKVIWSNTCLQHVKEIMSKCMI